MISTKLVGQHGFNDLSEGAKEIARHHDEHRKVADLLKEKPHLIDSLDEYNSWATVTIADIDRQDRPATYSHSFKKVLKRI
jgi:hypothetical protein